MAPRLVRAGLLLAVALVYLATARLGLSLAFVAEQITVVWPPTGIALAAVIAFGYRIWPAIMAGAFAANVMVDEPLATAAGIASGNTLEALLGAWLLRRAGFSPALDRVRGVFALVVGAAAISTMVSATIGVTSLCLGGVEPWSRFGRLWSEWWLGDAGGNLIVAPALLTWLAGPRRPATPGARLEAVALLSGLAATSLVVFAGQLGGVAPGYPLQYVVFPFIIYSGVRFGPRITASSILLVAVIATWGTSRGFGPFGGATPHEDLILLQLFMAAVAVTGLVLAAVTSERRRAGEEIRWLNRDLRRRVDELERLLDVAPIGIAVARDPECRYIDANPAFARAIGIPPGVNASKSGPEGHLLPFRVVRDGRELAPAELPMQQAAARGVAFRDVDLEVVHDDGSIVNMLFYACPLFDEEGRVRGALGAFVDYTARKRAQEELRRRVEQLAEADRRKDEFLAMLAHELRNPLAPIVTAVELMQRHTSTNPELGRILEIVGRQVRHMVKLVDDLLDVSRITRGKIRLVRAPVDVETVVGQAVEGIRAEVDARGLQLGVTVPPETLRLHADPTRLVQVIANLLHNAAKFTPPGGHIWLTAAREADEVVLRVRDDGIGIAPDLLPHVFDVFVQGETTPDRSRGGLGLGLSLVRSLVELHGGRVTATSAGAGRGSEFVVRLPGVFEPVGATPLEAAGPPAPGERLRVLVVDDNEDAAEMLASLLRVLGHEVHVAHDGPTALAMAPDLRPDVALLDIGLPGMSGYELARRLRQSPPATRLRLYAVSGYGRDDDRRRSREAGFDDHLVKPVQVEELQRLLVPVPMS